MSFCKYESELLTEWLSEMLYNENKYSEPILDMKATALIKEVCNMLKQDVHVFVFSVDILEEYISRKSSRQQEIEDFPLTMLTTVFVCSKFVGDQDVRMQQLETVLGKITGQTYTPKIVKLKEMEILGVLDNRLPINNKVDDLKTFVYKFEKESKIKVSILTLACEVLEMLYLTRMNWFHSLKSVYNINSEALDVFQKLIKNRFYLPIGILIYVFKITKYGNTLDIESILKDLANGSQIHVDHLNALISKIEEIINEL